jgi:lysophospholipase L1-like esterase
VRAVDWKWLTLPGGLLLGCLSVEAWARWGLAPPPLRPKIEGEIHRPSPEAGLGHELIPLTSFRMTYRSNPQDPGWIVEHQVNAQGWRGREHQRPKPPHVFRVACLGDSHTFGFGVDEDGTWPAALQRHLADLPRGRLAEVLNFGVGGLGAEEEALLLERRVLALEPDLIVLQMYMNDAERSYEGPIPTAAELGRAPAVALRAEGLWSWLRARSRAIDRVIGARVQARLTEQYVESRALRFAPGHPERVRLAAALRRMRNLAQARGIPMLAFYYPLLIRSGKRLMACRIGDELGRICAAEHVAYVDLEPVFLPLPHLDALRIHPLDYHVTAPAHGLAAQAVAAELHRRGFLSD